MGVTVSFVLGMLFGGLAGYYGGWVDDLVQRAIEILRSIPHLPLWLALAAILPAALALPARPRLAWGLIAGCSAAALATLAWAGHGATGSGGAGDIYVIGDLRPSIISSDRTSVAVWPCSGFTPRLIGLRSRFYLRTVVKRDSTILMFAAGDFECRKPADDCSSM